jgi:hypothetical protein
MKDEEHTNMSADRKERWKKITQETAKCPFCPPHDRENRGRRPKSDAHKNKDRKTIAEAVCEESPATGAEHENTET